MFDRFFKVNTPFWQSMGTVFDLFAVNCLWLFCCIPIFTIGPATTAAFYTLTQRVLKENATVTKDFFTSFKRNFKQGTLLGLLLTAIGAFLALDIYLCRRSGTGIFTFFLFFFAVIFIFWSFVTLYAFPILAKFDRTNKEILIWAFTLSVSNLPMTLTMLFVIAACLWFCHLIPGLVFIMFGVAAQFCTTVLVSLFKPFLPKPEPVEDDFESDVYNPYVHTPGENLDGIYTANGAYMSFDNPDVFDDLARMEGGIPEDFEEYGSSSSEHTDS